MKYSQLIYIVEDDLMFQNVVKFNLEKAGFTNIQLFTRGEDCISEMTQDPDFIIMDIGLHGLNGIDTLSSIKRISKHNAVIMLSATEDHTISEKCKEIGAYKYMVKSEEAPQKVTEALIALTKDSKYSTNFIKKLGRFLGVL